MGVANPTIYETSPNFLSLIPKHIMLTERDDETTYTVGPKEKPGVCYAQENNEVVYIPKPSGKVLEVWYDTNPFFATFGVSGFVYGSYDKDDEYLFHVNQRGSSEEFMTDGNGKYGFKVYLNDVDKTIEIICDQVNNNYFVTADGVRKYDYNVEGSENWQYPDITVPTKFISLTLPEEVTDDKIFIKENADR